MNSLFPRQARLIALAASFLLPNAFGQVNILTNRYNQARTAANASETQLTQANVNTTSFGKLGTYSVDGVIYAQPLYVQNVMVNGVPHNVLYVATMHDVLYAFDADNVGSLPLWALDFRNLAAGITPAPVTVGIGDGSNAGIADTFGILATPVIDLPNNRLFLVTHTMENGTECFRLRTVDIRSGALLNSTLITGSVPAIGSAPSVTFNPPIYGQRAALEIADGQVWVAFTSRPPGDSATLGAWYGWVMTYNPNNLAQTGVFATSRTNGNSIWQSGSGPAVDANGNVYFLTGNGGNYDGITEFPETLLQMSYRSGLALNNWYTPDYANGDNYYVYLNQYDLDVSVDGPMLIPGTDLITFGGKTGDMWILHTGNLGQLTPNDTQVSQFFHVGVNYAFPTFYGDRIVGNVYWQGPNGGNLYVWPGLDTLHVYTLNTATSTFSPSFTGTVNLLGSPGTALALSANGSSSGTGILWAPTPNGSNGTGQAGVLHAYNAENPAQELWNSSMLSTDFMGTLAKFTPPVVVNGKVYIANSAVNGDYGAGSVTVYGLKPAASGYVNPYASLTSPANASTFVSGSNITLSASAYPGSSPLASVAFLDGPNVLATITSPPYTYTWTSAAIGSHTINAVATDTTGVITLAGAETITVTGTPTYSLSASPDSLALPPGGKATTVITVTPLNGFSSPACEEIAGIPSGVSSSVAPAAATRGGPVCATSNTFTVTLTAASTAAQGTWKIAFITGANGTAQNTLFLPVTVSQSALVPGSNTVTLNVPNGATLGTPVVFTEAVPSSSLVAPDFSLVSTGTTCTGAISGTCAVKIQFTPQFPGLRRGAVNLVDTNNNLLATSYFYGTGPGSLAPLLPGSQTTIYHAGSPRGAAVDAAGNVFLVDNATNQLFKVSSGGTPVAVPLGTALNSPFGVALDAAGNLYIADAGNNRILELPYGGNTATALNLANLVFPEGVAVDGLGNLFIANTKAAAASGYGNIIKLAAGSGVQTTLVNSGLNYPSGVALDAAGDIFVADWGNNRVLEIPVSGPQLSLGSNLALASAVAVDAAGDVFIADENHNQVVELPGTASGPGTGTQSTLFSGVTKPYGLALDGLGDVFIGTVGSSTVPGSVLEIPTILTQTITFAPIATQTANTSLSLVASASSGLPVTFTSSTVAVCTVAGSTAALIGAGTCTIAAAQPGNSTYLAASSVSQSFTVSAQAQTITFSSIATQNLGASLTISASASSGLPVFFASTTPAVCTVSANTAALIASGTCTIVASQPGNNAYLAATPISQTFTVVASGETITTAFTIPAGVTLGTPIIFTEGVPSSSLNNPDFTLVSAGTTCTAAATGACSVSVKFTPRQAGLRRGAVKLVDNSNNVLATSFVSGIGPNTLPTWASGVPKTLYSSGYPRGVTVDGAGNVFLIDSGSNQLYKVPSGGKASAVAMGVTLNSPFGLALDAAGNLFIADAGNNRVLKLPYGGSTAAPVSVTGLNFPEGIAVDGAGNLFIANTRGVATSGNGTIVELSASGSQSIAVGSGLSYPAGVALDPAGDIFVADWGNSRVLEQSIGGAASSIGTGIANASAVAVDASGDVFIADENHNQVVEVPGTASGPGTGVQLTVATGLLIPYGLALDGQGDLFIANIGSGHTLGSVQQIPRAIGLTFTVPSGVTLGTPVVFTEGVPSSSLASPDFSLVAAQNACSGAVTGTCTLAVQFTPQFAGLRRGAVKLLDSNNNVVATRFVSGIGPNALPAWSAATFKKIYAPSKGFPRGVTVDGVGDVFVLDSYSNQVTKVAPSGQQTAISLGVTLNSPFGLALDAAGDLFVADAGNNRILQLPYGASTAAPLNITGLNFPEAVAIDGVGNLFIANTRGTAAAGNGNIIKVAAGTGTQTTLLASGLSYPSGIALDSAGDLFIADWGNNRVLEVLVSGQNVSIGSGLANASAVAVDAAGDVFIADENHNQLVEVPATASGPGTGTQTTVTTGLLIPYALALDGQGDIFIASVGSGSTSGSVLEVLRSGVVVPQTQTISFGAVPSQTLGTSPTLTATATSGLAVAFTSLTPTVCTASGSAATLLTTGICTIAASQAGSSAYLVATPVEQSFTVLGSGQTLATAFTIPSGVTLGTPVVFTEGVPSSSLSSPDFTLAATGTTCTAGAMGNCTVSVQFTPQFAGLRRGAVKLVDKNNNVLATAYISAVGINTLPAWTAGNSAAVFKTGYPRGVTIDGAGNLFVVDSGSSNVFKVVPGGVPTLVSLGTALNSPYGLALDAAGNLYIADAGNNRVLELPYGGNTATALNISGLTFPEALAVDGAGNLFIANTRAVVASGNGTVIKVAAGSSIQTTIAGVGLAYPSGVALDASGDVFIADKYNNRVLEIPLTGAPISIGSGLNSASAVAVDAAGDVFITDQGNNRLVEVAGTASGPGLGAQTTIATGLLTPYAVTLDGQGDVFVANVGAGATQGSVLEVLRAGVAAAP